MAKLYYFYYFTIGSILIYCCNGLIPNLSPTQTNILREFRKTIKDFLYANYQQEDVYLLNWLESNNFDVTRSTKALKRSLDYRKANGIDNILIDEEMKRMRRIYFFSTGGIRDKDGDPLLYVPVENWDIRRLILAGKRNQCSRYMMYMLENLLVEARQNNSSHGIFLNDLRAFSSRKHLCLGCVPCHVDFVFAYERHYPYTFKKAFLINAPNIFETLFNIIYPLMTPATQKIVHLAGLNRNNWSPLLLEQFSKDVLPREYGGQARVNRLRYPLR